MRDIRPKMAKYGDQLFFVGVMAFMIAVQLVLWTAFVAFLTAITAIGTLTMWG